MVDSALQRAREGIRREGSTPAPEGASATPVFGESSCRREKFPRFYDLAPEDQQRLVELIKQQETKKDDNLALKQPVRCWTFRTVTVDGSRRWRVRCPRCWALSRHCSGVWISRTTSWNLQVRRPGGTAAIASGANLSAITAVPDGSRQREAQRKAALPWRPSNGMEALRGSVNQRHVMRGGPTPTG